MHGQNLSCFRAFEFSGTRKKFQNVEDDETLSNIPKITNLCPLSVEIGRRVGDAGK